MKASPIYLDHAATTPLDPRVLDAMLPVLKADFGNPSSVHRLGRKARYLVEDARDRIADLLGAEPSEVIFTSGGTEANNAAIRGTDASRIVSTAAEHESVLKAVQQRNAASGPTELLTPTANGTIDLQRLAETLSVHGPGALVSVMFVNNETGAVNDIPAAAGVAHDGGGAIHTDAVQAAGHYRLNVAELGVDLLTLSAHKLYGPKGAGLLYVRGGMPIDALLLGGAQERGRRAGTENVAAIIGLVKALELAVEEMADRVAHIRSLQARLIRRISDELGSRVVINTPSVDQECAPHIVNVSFPPRPDPVDGEMLLLGLDLEGVCASSGSACTSGTIHPSHVLLAMGRDPATASAAVRFSIGKDNTVEQIDVAADALVRVAHRVAEGEKIA